MGEFQAPNVASAVDVGNEFPRLVDLYTLPPFLFIAYMILSFTGLIAVQPASSEALGAQKVEPQYLYPGI